MTPHEEQDERLSRLIKTQATRYQLPEELLESIQSQLPADAPQPIKRPWFSMALPIGSAFAAGIVVAVLAVPLWQASSTQNDFTASHVRSLQADHLMDVLSTDQHTVRPWFTGKLDYAPPVHDLATQGFPLIGGRLDMIEDQNVAALIFRHDKHVINLFVFPEDRLSHASCKAELGFHTQHWISDGMRWCAISDVSDSELKTFAQLQQGVH